MPLPIPNRLLVRALITLLGLGAVSALVGAIIAIAANGGGVPLEYLADSPFTSYLVPGLVLGVIVGGTQLAGALALIARRPSGVMLSAIAGFGMMIWIFVELAVIRQYAWLQTAYFVLGGLELVLALGMLGVAPTLLEPAEVPSAAGAQRQRRRSRLAGEGESFDRTIVPARRRTSSDEPGEATRRTMAPRAMPSSARTATSPNVLQRTGSSGSSEQTASCSTSQVHDEASTIALTIEGSLWNAMHSMTALQSVCSTPSTRLPTALSAA